MLLSNTGVGPNAITYAVADLNGDGHADIVSTPANGSLAADVSFGNGDGTFQPPLALVVPTGFNKVLVSDVNADGKPDLMMLDYIVTQTHTPTTLTVQLLNAAGVPQPGVTYDIGNSAGVEQVLDLNGDGHLDMVIENTVGDRVFINNGDSAFRDSGFHGSNGPVAVGDFNEDGIQDLVTTGGDIFLGNSDGSFNAPVSANVLGERATATAVGDLNGDGNPDTVVTNTLDNNVSVAFGNGHGQFWSGGKLSAGTAGLSGQGPRGVAIGDFTGDGIPDLAVNGILDIGVSFGRGDGGFYPQTFFNSTGGLSAVLTAADVNHDGRSDILQIDTGTSDTRYIAGGSLDTFLNTGKDRQPQFGAVGFKASAPPIVTENAPFNVHRDRR